MMNIKQKVYPQEALYEKKIWALKEKITAFCKEHPEKNNQFYC